MIKRKKDSRLINTIFATCINADNDKKQANIMSKKNYIRPEIEPFNINSESFLAGSFNAKKSSLYKTVHHQYEIDKTEISPDFGFHWDTGDEPYRPHDKE